MNNNNKYKQTIKLSQTQLDDLFDIDIMNKEEEQREQEYDPHIDELLDQYNSYKFLYNLFNDDFYKRKAKSTMTLIKILFGTK